MKGEVGSGVSQAKNQTAIGQVFEDSIARGRYALTLSIAEYKRLDFTRELAQFAAPDVASSNGKFVSIFPPGTALFLVPFYFLGSLLGVGQLMTSFSLMLLAVINGFVLYSLAKKLHFSRAASLLAAVLFLLGSSAFVYAGVLSQHHLTTFFLLSLFHVALLKNNQYKMALGLIIYAMGFVVDWPNLIILLPGVLLTLAQSLHFLKKKGTVGFVTIIISLLACIPVVFYLFYTTRSGSSPLAIGQFLPRVVNVTEQAIVKKSGKTGIFQTFFLSKIPNGLYVLGFSRERGILYFSPIYLLSVFGITQLGKKQRMITAVMLMTISLNVLLYASFGDPWGGPSFGSRYLIPSFALLSIFLVAFFESITKKILPFVSFALLGMISIAISLLGAMTTTQIPGKEAAKLDTIYPITIAINQLLNGKPGSYIFNNFFSFVSPLMFYSLLLIISCGLFILIMEKTRKNFV